MLTMAQRRLLEAVQAGATLMNADEVSPMWWLEGGSGVLRVHRGTAYALCKTGFLKHIRHWGGFPGMDAFTISDAGRTALSAQESPEC